MDFKTIIADLTRAGLTQSQIGALSGLKQGSITDLLRGRIKEPRYNAGRRLVALHRQVMRKATPPQYADTEEPRNAH